MAQSVFRTLPKALDQLPVVEYTGSVDYTAEKAGYSFYTAKKASYRKQFVFF